MKNLNPRQHFIAESHQSKLFNRYLVLLNGLSDLAQRAGYPIGAVDNVLSSKFLDLDPKRQLEILKAIEKTVHICQTAKSDGINLHDDRRLAWWAIKEFRLRPLSDAFTRIQPNDVIEIYSSSHVQIFRSFNFFRCLSYTLDQVLTYEWWELYERDESITVPMIKVVEDLISSADVKTIQSPFPNHWVREKFSQLCYSAQIESRLMSPLICEDTGAIGGYLNVFSLVEVKGR